MDQAIDDIEIADVGEPELQRLIDVGEPGGVEFKGKLPAKDGLGPSIAAFANSGGGWLLLGVRDDGSICGFDVPGRGSTHDWLRDKLQPAIDPLLEFRTTTVETPDGAVVAIRIPPSARTPHVLRAKGQVYERVPGGKRAIDNRARLVAMCQEPETAERLAVERLQTPPMVQSALNAHWEGPIANGQTRVAEWYVAATPLQVPPIFAGTVLQHNAIRTVERAAVASLQRLNEGEIGLHSRLTPRSRGYVIDGSSEITRDALQLTVDAAGVAVARWSTAVFRNALHLPGLGDGVLLPPLELVSAVLIAGHADGALAVHAFLEVTPTHRDIGPYLSVGAADLVGTLPAPRSNRVFIGGRLPSPDPEMLRRLADEWWRELGRRAELPLWEP